METLIKKRKKRKTRRCLDELRKKTLETNVCKLNKSSDVRAHKNRPCCVKNFTFLTSNRLTLNKTVRSETVTRFQLSRAENKKLLKLNANHTVNENMKSDIQVNIIPYKTESNISILGNKIIAEGTRVKESMPQEPNIHKISDSTTKTIMSFSPESQDEAINTKFNSSLEISSVLSSSSSSTSSTNFELDLQEEFMDSIESYIEHNIPQIRQCDFIEKSKETLIKTYMQNFYNYSNDVKPNAHRENDYNNIHDSPPTIIQNPKDYLGYVWKQCPITNSNEIVISSPTDSHSANSNNIPSSSPVTSVVYDSPEYTYYPHRLN